MTITNSMFKRLANEVEKKTTENVAVKPVDLYDFYGIASLSRKVLSEEHLARITTRLEDIRELYLLALKNRFGSWSGINDAANKKDFIADLKSSLNEEMESQVASMNPLNGVPQGFNIMAIVNVMNDSKKKKAKMGGAYAKALSENLANFGAADYPKIAQGIIDLYEAKTCKDIILSVDHMNDLQHCGGYVLVDFVAGQRDPNNTLGNQIYQEILDFKRDAMSPMDFAEHMSSDILEVVKEQYGEE